MAERILFMRLSSLGDVLLTSPAVRAARRAFPNARIVFMTYAQYAPLYAHNPRVDAVIPLERGAKGALDALKRIRAERFDMSVDLHGKRKTVLLARAAGIPRRLMRDRRHERTTHASHEALNALTPLGVASEEDDMEFFTTEKQERKARRLLEGAARPLTGFFPGASWEMRMWMPDRFAEIANRVMDRLGGGAVVVGGTNERARTERIAALTKGRAQTYVNLPLGTLAALIRQCDLFIACDSGPMHLSAAVQTPTIALFGPGNRDRFRLLNDRHTNLWEPIACSPCKQFRNHCRNNACLQLLTAERVWRAAEAKLRAVGFTP